jgi:hypothetical protein
VADTAVSPGPRPPAVTQVRAVLAMRASGLRGRSRPVLAGLAAIPLILAVAAGTGAFLPRDGGGNVVILLPAMWLGYAVTTTIAAATAGGRALLPQDQRAAFPLSPAADHLGTLLLAPLNVAWIIQSAGLLLAGSWAAGPHPATFLAVGVATLGWIVAVTVFAQAAGELVELLRTTAAGAWALRLLVLGAAAGLAVLAAGGGLVDALDRAPTVPLVGIALAAGGGAWTGLVLLLVSLAADAVAFLAIGVALVGLTRRRPPRAQVRLESTEHPPRRDPRSELAAALRIDRAGVWRSAPLRRGLVALPAAPALAAAAAQLDWYLVALLPCLVTAGAALLFGVNALCLDGTGAVWRASLPGAPWVLLTARLLLVAELSLLACAVAVGVAAVRAPAPPTVAEAVAVLCATIATTAQVVGHCARWSVTRPYAATLRDARDQPAPPAAMAAYSARLAVATTMTGLLLTGLARLGLTGAVVATSVAVTALGCRRALAAIRAWEDPRVRAHVVASVAGG